jgi:glucose/arabinose dehydrogenase
MLFANGSFYYQDDTKIMKVAYSPGDRIAKGPATEVANLASRFQSGNHWPKTLDRADDGTIYVGNGSDQTETTNDCSTSRPFRGGIFAIDNGEPKDGRPITKGFRNPIFVRCQKGHNNCFASELAKDYTSIKYGGTQTGREKLVLIRNGDDWGFPCCASKDVPYIDVMPAPDCSKVVPEDVSFFIADTPFGFDFEPGKWPAPFANRLFIALHGEFGSWNGAKVLAIATDPMTGLPVRGGTFRADKTQGNTGDVIDFAVGYDNQGKMDRGRPSDVTFSTDGRMFVAHDVGPEKTGNLGIVIWFAPLDLAR